MRQATQRDEVSDADNSTLIHNYWTRHNDKTIDTAAQETTWIRPPLDKGLEENNTTGTMAEISFDFSVMLKINSVCYSPGLTSHSMNTPGSLSQDAASRRTRTRLRYPTGYLTLRILSCCRKGEYLLAFPEGTLRLRISGLRCPSWECGEATLAIGPALQNTQCICSWNHIATRLGNAKRGIWRSKERYRSLDAFVRCCFHGVASDRASSQ